MVSLHILARFLSCEIQCIWVRRTVFLTIVSLGNMIESFFQNFVWKKNLKKNKKQGFFLQWHLFFKSTKKKTDEICEIQRIIMLWWKRDRIRERKVQNHSPQNLATEKINELYINYYEKWCMNSLKCTICLPQSILTRE